MSVPDSAAGHLADALDWLRDNASRLWPGHGLALLRGLPIRSADDVAAVRAAIGARPCEPAELFAVRTRFGPGVLAPQRWPPDRMLCPQHEQSYSLEFPGLLLHACLRAPDAGGAALLCDAAAVLAHLPPDLVHRFRLHGWLLARVLRERVGTSWRDAFGADDRAAIEEFVAHNEMAHEWLADGSLRTVRLRPATIHHPVTGAECWFNHAAFLNEWSLDPDEREVLLDAFGPGLLPTNTFCGDGSPLTRAEVLEIEATYRKLSFAVPMRAGDVLLVDNIRFAHGREPYRGDRDDVFASAEPVRLADCTPAVAPAQARLPT